MLLKKLSIHSDFFQHVFYFTIFLVLYKTLVPYGDEPDFVTRISRLSANPFFSFLNINDLKAYFLCSENYNRLSLGYKLSSACVTENLSTQYLSRILFPILNIAGILFILKSFLYVTNFKISNRDSRVIALTFLFPFTIYILGLTSNEIYVHFFSLFIFIESYFIRFFILSILYLLEYDGQFLVTLLFVCFSFFNKAISDWKLYYLLLFNLMICVFISFLFKNISYFNFLVPDIFVNKISEIMQPKPYTNYGFLPRLGIVFLSMSFMTANGIKLILGTLFFFLRHLSGQLLKIQKIYIIEILSAISTLSLIIAILPSHSYAKYYMFLIPVTFKALISIIDFNRLKNSLLIANCLNLTFLLFLIYA